MFFIIFFTLEDENAKWKENKKEENSLGKSPMHNSERMRFHASRSLTSSVEDERTIQKKDTQKRKRKGWHVNVHSREELLRNFTTGVRPALPKKRKKEKSPSSFPGMQNGEVS